MISLKHTLFRGATLMLMVMMLVSIAVSASATTTDPCELTVGSITGNPGETVTVPVMVKNNEGFAGFKFFIDYDSDALTLKKVVKGEVLTASGIAYNLQEDVVIWLNSSNCSGDGTLLTLTFQIAENALAKDYAVSIDVSEYFSVDSSGAFHDIQPRVIDGCISMAKEECPYYLGQTSQIWLIEPWALRANLRVYHFTDEGTRGEPLSVAEMKTLEDYGVYFVRESDLGRGDVTQDDVAVEEIINNAHVIHKSKANGGAVLDGTSNRIGSDFDEGIYTYQLSDSIYVAYYIVVNGQKYYAPVRERNLSTMVEAGITDTKNYTNSERAIFEKMHQLEMDILEYRGGAQDTTLKIMDAPTLAENPIRGTVTTKKFGHTMAVSLVEPWGIQFNGKIALDKEYDDYGVIVFYDTEGRLKATPTAEEMFNLSDARIFSYQNEDVTIAVESDGRTRITALYNSGLYTYQMRKIAYVMFYVQDGNTIYCGEVKERTIEGAIDSRLSVSGVANTLEGIVLQDMKELYTVTVAHRGDK